MNASLSISESQVLTVVHLLEKTSQVLRYWFAVCVWMKSLLFSSRPVRVVLRKATDRTHTPSCVCRLVVLSRDHFSFITQSREDPDEEERDWEMIRTAYNNVTSMTSWWNKTKQKVPSMPLNERKRGRQVRRTFTRLSLTVHIQKVKRLWRQFGFIWSSVALKLAGFLFLTDEISLILHSVWISAVFLEEWLPSDLTWSSVVVSAMVEGFFQLFCSHPALV